MKWLCGGPGNGWLYVRPDLAESLTPTFTGWQAHARPFAFEEEMEYASGAARFLTGTPNPAAHYAGTAGYDLVEEIGVARIRENSLRQTQLLIDLADAAGFEVTQPARSRSPRRIGRRPRSGVRGRARGARGARESSATSARMRASASARTTSTTDDEIRFAVEQIAEIVETGAYERHLGAVALH